MLLRIKMSKGEETKQFIIECAAPIFNTKGIEATAMSDIMAATQLSKGSMYVHFENKDVLVSAVVDYNMKMLGKKVALALSKHQTNKAKLFAYIDFFNDPINPPIKGGCPIINFGMEADDTNKTIREKIYQVILASENLITTIVEQGKTSGEFKKSWNAKEFASIMFAMIEGSFMLSRVAGNADNMRLINKTLKAIIKEQII